MDTHRHFLQQRRQICNKAIECINRIELDDPQKYKYVLRKEPLKRLLVKEIFSEF